MGTPHQHLDPDTATRPHPPTSAGVVQARMGGFWLLLMFAAKAAAMRHSAGLRLEGEAKYRHQQSCPPMSTMSPCRCREKSVGLDITCANLKNSHSLESMTLKMKSFSREKKMKGDYNIGYFKIRDSSIVRLTDHVFMGLKIVHLMIYNSNLASLNSASLSSVASTLKHLVLSNNKLEKIPSSALEQLRELEHLNLNQNNITSIPTRAFHGCHKLTRLTLYDNKIHNIHPDAFDGVQKDLQRLNLYRNLLTDIPRIALQRLTKLSHLDLSENQIKTIPPRAFEGLKALDFLALNHNHLTMLSASQFEGLPSLSSLELDYNKIAKIDSAAFKGLESELQQLSITHNKLNFFPSPALRPLYHLQTLHLDSNAITTIESNAFQGYGEHIKNLWLQNNHITTIEDDAFDDLHSLQWLKLWNNDLQTLHYELMEPVLDTLIHLDIHSNPLVCDCEMRWYKRWYHDGWQDVDEDHIKNTSCTDPIDRQEHPIHQVSLDHMYCPRALVSMTSSQSSMWPTVNYSYLVHPMLERLLAENCRLFV